MELLWVFKHLTLADYVPSQAEIRLADSMIGYWTRFAANTDPNGAGALAWPVYDPATDPYLNLDDTITSMAGLRAAKCDFWEKLVP
jgi:carboxylesterase type B